MFHVSLSNRCSTIIELQVSMHIKPKRMVNVNSKLVYTLQCLGALPHRQVDYTPTDTY